jgi:hypothetical protein
MTCGETGNANSDIERRISRGREVKAGFATVDMGGCRRRTQSSFDFFTSNGFG